MTKKFLCVQGSPETPKDSTAVQYKPDTLYEVYSADGSFIKTMKPCSIEGNDCWEVTKEEPEGRWRPENGDGYFYISSFHKVEYITWNDHEVDNNLFDTGNVYRTEQEAQDEVKRRESIAKAWWPEEGEWCYKWDFQSSGSLERTYQLFYIPDAYVGACHPTKEACEAWGKEYAHLFDKRPKHD